MTALIAPALTVVVPPLLTGLWILLHHKRRQRRIQQEYLAKLARRRFIVVAGDRLQALDWCREHQLSREDALIVSEPSNLWGLRGTWTLVYAGTWATRPGINRIRDEIRYLTRYGVIDQVLYEFEPGQQQLVV